MLKKLVAAGHCTGRLASLRQSNFTVPVIVGNRRISAVVDTGASVSCAHVDLVRPLAKSFSAQPLSLMGADGQLISVRCVSSLSFSLNGQVYQHPFHVIHRLSYPLILGLDFLSNHGFHLNCSKKSLRATLPAGCQETQRQDDRCQATATTSVLSIFSAGVAKIDPCVIKLRKGAKPMKQPLRRRALVEGEKIDAEINKMIACGAIRESSSPWSSPIHLVPKKNGEIRFCIDYRAVNDLIESDAYPLPHIGDLISRLYNRKIFSTIDLKSGYWQFPLDEDSKAVTAFSTQDNHYEFHLAFVWPLRSFKGK